MKRLWISFLVLLYVIGCSDYRRSPEVKALRRAARWGAKAKLTVKTVDMEGNILSNSFCSIGFCDMSRSLKDVEGYSDENGLFTAEGKAKWYIGGIVQKEGYYQSVFTFLQSARMERLKDGCWTPWNPIIPVELQKIRNPVPMYVCEAGRKKAFEYSLFPCNTEIGFDCEKRDFVSPHGNGLVTDFTVRISSIPMPREIEEQIEDCVEQFKEAENDKKKQYDINKEFNNVIITYHELVLSVPDEDGGFIRMKKLPNKVLASVYEAPTDGYSKSIRMIRENERKQCEYHSTDVTDDEYLVFRTRIVRNEEGKIVSANYGKIYGPINHYIIRWLDSAMMEFDCYYNPIPNNRSIEFDGKNNLFFPQHKVSKFAP